MLQRLRHGRVELALHQLSAEERGGGGPPLLLLHALYGSSADWGSAAAVWPGAVYALDFSGHGDSDWLDGRGYSPEVFAAEADMAIERIAPKSSLRIAGAGLGAYVALLLGGARAGLVDGVLLLPGAGLSGGGALPADRAPEAETSWQASVRAQPREPGEASPDPLVNRCEFDVRPLYYSEEFARAAAALHIAEMPETPPWLETVLVHGKTRGAPSEISSALKQLAAS